MKTRNLSEQQIDRLTVLVGAFIAAVRSSQKAPAISSLYKEKFGVGIDAAYGRRFNATMAACVASIGNDGSARLYRDNRPIDELMPVVIKTWNTINVPKAKTRKSRVQAIVSVPTPLTPKIDLSSISEDELVAELNRREEARKAQEELNRKKAFLKDAADLLDISIDELISIAVEIAEII